MKTKIPLGAAMLRLAPALFLPALLMGAGLVSSFYESLGFLNPTSGASAFNAYREILTDPDLIEGLLFGVYISLVSSFLSVAIGAGAALFFAPVRRLGYWGAALAGLPVALPHIVAAAALSQFLSGNALPARLAFHLGWGMEQGEGLFHLLPGLGVILTYLWKGFPFVFLVTLTRLAQIDPLLREAARSLGASGFRATVDIVLPLLKKTLWGAFLILTAFSFSAFEIPYLVGPTRPRTLPEAIFALYGTPGLEARSVAMAASVVLLLLSFGLFLLYRRVEGEGRA